MLRYLIVLFLFALAFTSCTEDPVFEMDEVTPQIEETTTTSINAEYQNLLDLVNQLRATGCRCGNQQMPPVAALQWNNKLGKAALRHSKDMKNNNHFSHTGTDNSTLGDRITATGYNWRTIGENIAYNYNTANAVFNAWKNSPGHCRNMMKSDFTEMGAARIGAYYTQDFGAQR